MHDLFKTVSSTSLASEAYLGQLKGYSLRYWSTFCSYFNIPVYLIHQTESVYQVKNNFTGQEFFETSAIATC